MQLQVIQWNISSRSDPNEIARYLTGCIRDDMPCIICLQEVIESSFQVLRNILAADSVLYSLHLRPRGKHEGRNRALGVAVFGFNLTTVSCSLVDRSVFPERTLDVTFYLNQESIRILNFHSLTGVDYKKAKSSNFASLADHLQSNPDIDFMCFDANEPRIDSLLAEKREFYDNRDRGVKAALLMGAKPSHNLHDALVQYMLSHGETEDKNPLAKSFITGKTSRRYDHVYAHTSWQVESIEYRYDDAIRYTSDHAVVIGLFSKLHIEAINPNSL